MLVEREVHHLSWVCDGRSRIKRHCWERAHLERWENSGPKGVVVERCSIGEWVPWRACRRDLRMAGSISCSTARAETRVALPSSSQYWRTSNQVPRWGCRQEWRRAGAIGRSVARTKPRSWVASPACRKGSWRGRTTWQGRGVMSEIQRQLTPQHFSCRFLRLMQISGSWGSLELRWGGVLFVQPALVAGSQNNLPSWQIIIHVLQQTCQYLTNNITWKFLSCDMRNYPQGYQRAFLSNTDQNTEFLSK